MPSEYCINYGLIDPACQANPNYNPVPSGGGGGAHLSAYCANPANLYSLNCQMNPSYSPQGNVQQPSNVIQFPSGGVNVQSPSTVWMGSGEYSRTLQAILSGIALWRGASNVPTATQGISAQIPAGQSVYGGGYGGGGYGNVAAGGSAGTNFGGQFQLLVEKHPGTVAIGAALLVAFAIGQLKPKRRAM